MNNKVNISTLYGKYKEFTIPVIVILVCFILLIKFIIPQFHALFTIKSEAKNASSILPVLKNNFNVLSRLNDPTLDSQLQIVNAALPINKDFIGIINAISYASLVSGVNVGDFQLEIGDLSEVAKDTSKFSSISLNLSVNGGVDDINKFIKALSTTLPISEASSINIGNISSSVTINFYYKPLPPLNYSQSAPINPIPHTMLALINNLSSFNYNLSNSFESISSPSSSLINPF